jgi:nicotinamide-nucleotide amidase
MFDNPLRERAEALVQRFAAKRSMLAAAESCTGGLLGALITAIPGSSAVFERGFIVYSNAAKTELLGVSESLLAAHGAVSEACARALAEGAIARSRADVAVSITGIAGPGGGSAEKPVGLVHFGLAIRGGEVAALRRLYGDLTRDEIRRLAVEDALGLLERTAPPSQFA